MERGNLVDDDRRWISEVGLKYSRINPIIFSIIFQEYSVDPEI